MGRFGRFIVEYVGNLEPLHQDDPDSRPPSGDRRVNHHARELVDWVKGQMEERRFSAARKDEFVNDLRTALRQGEGLRDGGSEDEIGRSRDARS